MMFEVTWSRAICAKKLEKTFPSRRRSSECPAELVLKTFFTWKKHSQQIFSFLVICIP